MVMSLNRTSCYNYIVVVVERRPRDFSDSSLFSLDQPRNFVRGDVNSIEEESHAHAGHAVIEVGRASSAICLKRESALALAFRMHAYPSPGEMQLYHVHAKLTALNPLKRKCHEDDIQIITLHC